jgi:DNA-binding IclR family transcriptional regulator
MRNNNRASRRVKSVDVTARLLEALARSQDALSLTQLAQSARISPSRAHAYAAGMLAAGLLEQSGPYARYGLGPLARIIGTAAVAQYDPIELVDQAASELREHTQLTVALAVWHPNGPVIVRWIRGAHPLPVQVSIGSTIPLTTTAIGRVFLTHLPAKITAPIVRRELAALASAENEAPAPLLDLETICERTREAGFAYVRGTLLPEMYAVAAPVMQNGTWVLAVLSVIGTAKVHELRLAKRTGRTLLRFTQKASNSLIDVPRARAHGLNVG